MKKYLIDTNIVSEVRKGNKGNQGVIQWYGFLKPTDLYLSVVTLGELARGINLMQPDDPTQAKRLYSWYCDCLVLFKERIIEIDLPIMEAWAKVPCRRTIPSFDALLAATAAVCWGLACLAC